MPTKARAGTEFVPILHQRRITVGWVGTGAFRRLPLQRSNVARTGRSTNSCVLRRVLCRLEYEDIDNLIELVCLTFRLFDRCIGLLNQSGVVLGHFIHLANGDRYFPNCVGLLLAGHGDPVDQFTVLQHSFKHNT